MSKYYRRSQIESIEYKYYFFSDIRLRTNYSIDIVESFSIKDDDDSIFTNSLEYIQNKLIGYLSKDIFKNYFFLSSINAIET